MNSKERVLAALSGRSIDRRAVSLTLSLYGARLTNCPLTQYYTDPLAYGKGQSAALQTFSPDILFAPFALSLEGHAFGGRVRFFTDQAPNLAQSAIDSTEAIEKLKAPDINLNPTLGFFREAVRTMANKYGKDVPICAVTLDPVSLPAMIMGLDGWLNTLLFDQENTRRMLQITGRHFIQWVNALQADGASFIALPTVLLTPNILPRKLVEKIALPVLREVFSKAGLPLIIHSTGAPLVPFIDLFTPLPNVVGFLLNAGESFLEARQKIGPQPLLIGNLDGPTLNRRRPEEISGDCKRILLDRKDDPHFILGTSAADIAFATPIENIQAIRRAVEDFK